MPSAPGSTPTRPAPARAPLRRGQQGLALARPLRVGCERSLVSRVRKECVPYPSRPRSLSRNHVPHSLNPAAIFRCRGDLIPRPLGDLLDTQYHCSSTTESVGNPWTLEVEPRLTFPIILGELRVSEHRLWPLHVHLPRPRPSRGAWDCCRFSSSVVAPRRCPQSASLRIQPAHGLSARRRCGWRSPPRRDRVRVLRDVLQHLLETVLLHLRIGILRQEAVLLDSLGDGIKPGALQAGAWSPDFQDHSPGRGSPRESLC
jgi:hypothetical protein